MNIVPQNNSRIRANSDKVDLPLDCVRRWGSGHFVSEVKTLLESERVERGYYPTLPEILAVIRREFGADFVFDRWWLPPALRRHGILYSEAGALEYQKQVPAVEPLLDLSAPYRLPWGTVGNYLLWRLPRMLEGDSFEVDGVTITRIDFQRFQVSGKTSQGLALTWNVKGLSTCQTYARVLMALRGGGVKGVEPAHLTKTQRKAVRDVSREAENTVQHSTVRDVSQKAENAAQRKAAGGVSQKIQNVAQVRHWQFIAPLMVATGKELPALPSMRLDDPAARRKLARQWNRMGYAPSEIAVALAVPIEVVRADLAKQQGGAQ